MSPESLESPLHSAAVRLETLAPQLSIRDSRRLQRQLGDARRGRKFDPARFGRDLEAALLRAENRARLVPPVIAYPEALPVTQARESLLETLRAHAVVVVCGETGSGKSTQLPKLLLEAGCGRRGQIGHTQPRRLAARTLSTRIAQEMGVALGDLVGYETRFDRRVSERTLIKLMTDGILLAELERDRWLENYDAIIIDEAHERSLNIDFLLGRLKQIHARRPELKIVITSATLDPERLARHFGDAPIATVEGRMFPVEQRYRERGEDEELEDQVAAAIDSLWRGGAAGDTLVFLPGEREINELSRMLPGRFPRAAVLPLYSRLPVAQQDRVFRSGGPPKIVCTTNVAETSVTVPGIRYVVDAGTARMSRYAPRLGVQHLEIEPVSQAAANQRAGRCGRVGPGICVRLYTADDFASRPLFTDPEIKRSNLAGVILRMASLRLGEIEDFPWLDAPEPRHIAEGHRILQVLGAMQGEAGARELTPLGREIGRLPLDPRVARIALAGRGTPCETAVWVLAAALSVQDPHENPAEARDAARQKHAEWRDSRSDFLSLLNLWQRWLAWSAAGGKRGLRRLCEQHFLSFNRMQEWEALYRQIAEVMGKPAVETASTQAQDELYAPIHQALLAGLIDHIGQKKPDPPKKPGQRPIIEYVGPRGRRFRIVPGSALARKSPEWIVSAQLAQTSQLFARTNAAIEPEWLVKVGAHLVKRSIAHPRWNAGRGEVTAMEHVSLLGMPLVQRPCHYGSHHPAEAREIFILEALVRGDLPHKPAFLAANLALAEDIRDKEARLRRPDLLASETQLCAFYDARLPAEICTVATLKNWLRRGADGKNLAMTEADALRPGADPDIASQFPDNLDADSQRLRLSYRHDPGSELDGLSVHIPLALLHGLSAHAQVFDWLVPGLRLALLEGLIRTLPNELRRRCTPAASYAEALNASLSPADGALLPAICGRFRAMNGVELKPEDFHPELLDAHLRPRFIVENDSGAVVAEADSLAELQSRMSGPAREALRQSAKGEWTRSALTDWDFGDLPETVSLANGAVAVPALSVEGSAVGLRLFESRAAADQAQSAAQRALLLSRFGERVRDLRKAAKTKFGMSLIGTRLTPEGLIDELLTRIAGELLGETALRQQAQFEAALQRGAEFSQRAYARLDELAGWLAQASELRRKLAPLSSRWPESAADLRGQLDSLFAPGLVSRLPAELWPRIAIWLRAASLRLERMANKPQRDLELSSRLGPFLARLSEPFHPARWLIEEWRVQLFAQELRALGAPTEQKILAALAN